MLLKSRASLTCFRACFLPGRATDLSAPRGSFRYYTVMSKTVISVKHVQQVNTVFCTNQSSLLEKCSFCLVLLIPNTLETSIILHRIIIGSGDKRTTFPKLILYINFQLITLRAHNSLVTSQHTHSVIASTVLVNFVCPKHTTKPNMLNFSVRIKNSPRASKIFNITTKWYHLRQAPNPTLTSTLSVLPHTRAGLESWEADRVSHNRASFLLRCGSQCVLRGSRGIVCLCRSLNYK